MKTNYLNKWWAVLLLMLTMGVAQVSAQTTAYSLTENTTLNGENIINTGIDQWASWAGAASKLQSSNKCSEISEYINLNARGVNIKLTNLKSFQIRGYSGKAERSFDYYINGEKVGSTAPGNTSCFLSDEYEVNSAKEVVLQIMSIGGSVYLGQVILTAMPSCTTATAAFATPEPAAQDLKGTFTNTLISNDNESPIIYSSSDNDVATVDAEGKVTPVKAGSVTITATQVADATYCAVEESYELTFFDSDDETPPTADSQSITDGTTGVALDKPITITFSEPITAANVTINSVSSTEFSIAGNVLTITETLANCENYAISVSGATDAAGNVSTEEINFSFRTAGMPGEVVSKTITTYGTDAGAGALTIDALNTLLNNADFTLGGRSTYDVRLDDNTADASCADYDFGIMRFWRYDGANSELIFTFPEGVGSFTIVGSATGGRTATLSTSVAGVADVTNVKMNQCGTGTISPNTFGEPVTITLSMNSNGDTQIKSITYTVQSTPLSSNDKEVQEVEQGAAIEEIIFTGYAVPQISSADKTKLEGIGLVVDNDGTETLSISGTINADAASGIYTYQVTIDECTAPIQGSIEVIAAPEPLEKFVMKWSDNAVISGGKTETGSIKVAELSTDRQDKMEVYFNFAEGYEDCFLVVNGTKYERVDIEWQGNVVGQGAYIDFGSSANGAIVQVVRPDSAPQASKGLQRAAGDPSEFGTVVAEYTLAIQSVGTGSNDINAKEKEVKDCFNVLGVQVDCESNGIVIKRFTDGSSEKMLK